MIYRVIQFSKVDPKHDFGCFLAEGKVQTASEGPYGDGAVKKIIDKASFDEIWNEALKSAYPVISPWVINETYEVSFEESMKKIYGE